MEEIKKTRREYLKVLPLQKRLQAMENIRIFNHFFQEAVNSMCDKNYVILEMFTFTHTKQGSDYWWTINEKYFSNGE